MKISIMIPCHNEEKSIKACIDSCLNQTRKLDEIIIVNDGSTDNSYNILRRYGEEVKVIDIKHCTGNKSYAQQVGLQYITGDVFITTDGDTVLDSVFVEQIENSFNNNSDVVAVCGYVKSLRYNWLTACRQIDYVMAQNIHKLAQSYLKFIMVIPGCAAAFKVDIFREYIKFEHDTLTEDLDFTYKLNHKDFKIQYNDKAIVYTQDPADLHSYIRQMRRWYVGGWQNLRKHFYITNKPKCALELSLVYFEGLLYSILFFIFPLLNIRYFGLSILSYLFIAMAMSVYAAIVSRRIDLVFYSPLYLVVGVINAWIFIAEFVGEIVLKKETLTWFKPERRDIV